MDNKKFAKDLREAARKHLDGALHVAERLHAVADEMDPPPRTIATTRAKGCMCDVCGDHVEGLQWIGDRCLVDKDKDGRACLGTYRLDPEPVTDRAGNDLGVSLAELAAGQLRDDMLAGLMMEADLDDLSDREIVIASTFGRRAR
jgi:hypothetical protein